ncbi:hypothetical protein G6L37_05505 [Agrobacterium rubi]|nr:hypothetical protein [Agrobacterium rubi]NTF24814.1 hypothetical protein [Agrobacterium rubi]
MAARTYGRIVFSQEDLGIVRRMLERGLETVTVNLASAAGEDERLFYSSTRDRYERELARFNKARPGNMSFTEDDLAFVRGSIFPVLFPELMSRWAAKHELVPEEVTALSAEIDHLEKLQARFMKPFLSDHSQDAEPDEDDEAEDDDVEDTPSM